jgi:2-C-methyl-D-erythritol 4-phosphate cytidylyltransferase
MINSDLAVILPAAGASRRFGGVRGKLLETLAGKPVLLHCLETFHRHPIVRFIVVAVPSDASELKTLPLGDVRLCAGGPSRAQSVLNALRAVPESIGWVAVHDAARPLVREELIDRVFAAALSHGGAAAPALAVTQTIKEAGTPLPAKVVRTVSRHRLWALQTPQIAPRQQLLDAFAKCPIPLDEVTDDLQVLELAGESTWLVRGEEMNLKITTAADLQLAEFFLRSMPGPPAR